MILHLGKTHYLVLGELLKPIWQVIIDKVLVQLGIVSLLRYRW